MSGEYVGGIKVCMCQGIEKDRREEEIGGRGRKSGERQKSFTFKRIIWLIYIPSNMGARPRAHIRNTHTRARTHTNTLTHI